MYNVAGKRVVSSPSSDVCMLYFHAQYWKDLVLGLGPRLNDICTRVGMGSGTETKWYLHQVGMGSGTETKWYLHQVGMGSGTETIEDTIVYEQAVDNNVIIII